MIEEPFDSVGHPADLVRRFSAPPLPGSDSVIRALRALRGRFIVVKVGGKVLNERQGTEQLAEEVATLCRAGLCPIVVHGGGPQIDAMLARAGLRATRVEGLRVTDRETMDIVEMVLAGQINKQLTSTLARQGVPGVGLTGRDAGLLGAVAAAPVRSEAGQLVDLGRVGHITRVSSTILESLCRAHLTPVLAPVAEDAGGGALNVNADEVAAEVAVAVRAHALVTLSDVAGVRDDDGHVLPVVTAERAHDLVRAGTVCGGMVPKLRSALGAVDRGVRQVAMVGGLPRPSLASIVAGASGGTRVWRSDRSMA